MITKKTKKTNPKTTTKKASQPKKKKSNGLNTFFNVVGFVGIVGGLIIGLGSTAHAQGIFITEPFSCEVTLADYAELQRVLEVTPRTDYKYKIFLSEYEAVSKVLAEHAECKGI